MKANVFQLYLRGTRNPKQRATLGAEGIRYEVSRSHQNGATAVHVAAAEAGGIGRGFESIRY